MEKPMNYMKVEVLLEELKDHLVESYGEIDITLTGYNLLNKFTEVSVLEPDKINYEGKLRENPLVIKNEYGEVERVIYKCLAVGYAPNGHICVTSSTLHYNPAAYLLKDLMGVIAEDEKAGKITRENLLTQQEKSQGFCMPFYKNDLVVWVDINNVDVIKAMENFINNQTYAERIAQSLCKRNALKQHPALSNSLSSIEGEEGFRRSRVVLSIPIHKNHTREELIKIAEAEANVNLLDETIIYKETEVLTSESILGFHNHKEEKTINPAPAVEDNKPLKITQNKSETSELLAKLNSLDKNSVQTTFNNYFSKRYDSLEKLNMGELKFLIKKCGGKC